MVKGGVRLHRHKGTKMVCKFTCVGLVRDTVAANKYKGLCNEIHHTCPHKYANTNTHINLHIRTHNTRTCTCIQCTDVHVDSRMKL